MTNPTKESLLADVKWGEASEPPCFQDGGRYFKLKVGDLPSHAAIVVTLRPLTATIQSDFFVATALLDKKQISLKKFTAALERAKSIIGI